MLLFLVSAATTAFLVYKNWSSTGTVGSNGISSSDSLEFKKFQQTYLIVYFCVMAGDWLQGPYVYALYSSYGFDQYDIAVLFVAGFGSSMIFGTFIGSLADRFGRKVSGITKHI